MTSLQCFFFGALVTLVTLAAAGCAFAPHRTARHVARVRAAWLKARARYAYWRAACIDSDLLWLESEAELFGSGSHPVQEQIQIHRSCRADWIARAVELRCDADALLKVRQ